MTDALQIAVVVEHEIAPTTHRAITALRNASFPAHAVDRSYYKQRPHFRCLAYADGALIGHLGLDHRMIAVGATPHSIFGVIDLCVAAEARGQGIASRMLEKLSALAEAQGIDFLLLFADDHRLYARHGFAPVTAAVTWLKIDEHKSYGLGCERFENELMVKPTGDTTWPAGTVDLLGYLF